MRKRLLALVLAGLMAVSTCVPAFAQEDDGLNPIPAIEQEAEEVQSEDVSEDSLGDETQGEETQAEEIQDEDLLIEENQSEDTQSEDTQNEEIQNEEIQDEDSIIGEDQSDDISEDAQAVENQAEEIQDEDADEVIEDDEVLDDEVIEADEVLEDEENTATKKKSKKKADEALDEEEVIEAATSGQAGANVTWELTGSASAGYTLTLSGRGPMNNYSSTGNSNSAPWSSNRKKITKVVIADGITTIGNSTFIECTKLNTIAIPATVTSIGSSAFQDCSELTAVSMGNKVTCIGVSAFQNCSKLSRINLSTALTEIKSLAFSGCSSLASVILPASLTRIEHDAFNGCSIQSITLPKKLGFLGYQAFANCANLTTVRIPKTTAITDGTGMFINCTSLKSVYIEQGDYTKGLPNYWSSKLGKNMFKNCVNLETVTLPTYSSNGNEYVFASCFEGCSKLKKIILPKNTIGIYENAFKDCVSLEYLKFTKGLKSADPYAFSNTPKIVVHCYKDTYGETFCKNNYLPYKIIYLYSIIIHPNGGKPSQSVQIDGFENEEVYQMPDCPYTRKGYNCTCWTTKKDGKGVKIANKGTFADLATSNNQKIHLYAQWKRNTYNVKFNANGGKGTMSKMSVTYGKSKKLTKNKFKRKGYTFKGWAKSKKRAKKGIVDYKNKASVKNLSKSGKNNATVTLYAVWKKKK